MNEASTEKLEFLIATLGLPADDVARLLGVSVRSLFRWRATRIVPDAAVQTLLTDFCDIFDDARKRGDLPRVVEFIRNRAAEGRGALLRPLFAAFFQTTEARVA